MEAIVAALAANALVLGALTYLVRSLISHRLEKDVAEFKSSLEKQASQEIESFRSNLEKERLRMQISYGGIFEKQAEAIMKLYTVLTDLQQTTEQTIHYGNNVATRKAAFQKVWHELWAAHQRCRILLTKELDESIQEIMERMLKGVLGYMSVEARDFTRVTDEEFKRLTDKQDVAFEIIYEEVPALREKLIDEMRRTIGVAFK